MRCAIIQRFLPSHLVGTGNHQMPIRLLRQDFGEGLDQQIASFLGMNPAHEQRQLLAAQFGIAREKLLQFQFRIAFRFGGAVTDHHLVAAIEPERLAGQDSLLLTSEQHGLGIAQHPIFRPWPVHPFLEMLQRILLLEPWIEHAVSEQNVRRAGIAQSAPGAKAVKLPDPVDDDGVVPATVGTQPRDEPGAEAVTRASSDQADRPAKETVSRRQHREHRATQFQPGVLRTPELVPNCLMPSIGPPPAGFTELMMWRMFMPPVVGTRMNKS